MNDDNEPQPCYGANDELYGGPGDDLLDGGAQNDSGDGGLHFDTCVLMSRLKLTVKLENE